MSNVARIEYTSCTQCMKCSCKIDVNGYDYRCAANNRYWHDQERIGLYGGPMNTINIPDWCPYVVKEGD